MNSDRELDARIAAQSTIARQIDKAQKLFNEAATPAHEDTRRRLVLGEVTGWLDASLVRGEDVSQLWALIAAVAQSALEAGLVEESRRPLNGRWEP